MIATFANYISTNTAGIPITSIDTEVECAALCAIGCADVCQTYLYNAVSKECLFVDWAQENIAGSFTLLGFQSSARITTANNLAALALASMTTLSGTATNINRCPTAAPGTAVITANVVQSSFGTGTDGACILVIHQTKPGKKTTLTLKSGLGGVSLLEYFKVNKHTIHFQNSLKVFT